MFQIYTLVFIGVAGILGLIFKKILQKNLDNYPPGPSGLPLIGNLHQLGSKPLDVFKSWEKKYGDVVGLHFGSYRVVILNGYENIKEAYGMWEFSGRPLLRPFHEITGGEKSGLVLSEGEAWSEQRRFALRNLRDFGFGKKSMEALIHEDISDLIASFEEVQDEPFVPHRKFSTAVVRSLWNIIAGERFTYGDPRFQTVLDSLHSIISSASISGPVLFIPWLATILPHKTGWAHFKKVVGVAKEFVGGYIKEHRETYQTDNIRDYIDVYLKEISDTSEPGSSFHKEKGEKHLLIGVMNLLGAGAETTSNTMVWALHYLAKFPEVQQKLYDEIISVVGKSRMPSLGDRDSCIYTWAVMEEVLRISSLVPMGIFHNTMQSVKFRGYVIPKDTLILSNLYGVHYDKRIWNNPEVFLPERFLDISLDHPSGFVKKANCGPVIAFSVGKRACLGEVLARNNFFLYLTGLVQKFQFTPSSDYNGEATPGLIRVPKEFSIVLRERN